MRTLKKKKKPSPKTGLNFIYLPEVIISLRLKFCPNQKYTSEVPVCVLDSLGPDLYILDK